jgi:hypothetical protein
LPATDPFLKAVHKPRNDDAGHCPNASAHVAAIPDVTGIIARVGGAVVAMRISERIDRARPVGRTNGQPSKGLLQGLQQLLAEMAAGNDRQVRILRQIGNAADIRNFAVEKIPHEE